MKALSLLWPLLLLCNPGAVASGGPPESCARKIEETGRMKKISAMADVRNLLVIVAMDVEERALGGVLEFESVALSSRFGVEAKRAAIGERALWVLNSGVGGVNAAVGVALLLEKQPIDAIILMGVGGALSDDLKMGDVVLSRHIVQHDSVLSGANGFELMAPGHLYLSLPPEARPSPRMAGDAVLLEWMKKALEVPGSKERLVEGTILSGAEFAATADRKRELASRDNDALLIEMEAAGVAQVALRAGVPFVAAKTVVDGLNPQGDDLSSDYKTFLDAAAEHAGRLVDTLVKTFD